MKTKEKKRKAMENDRRDYDPIQIEPGNGRVVLWLNIVPTLYVILLGLSLLLLLIIEYCLFYFGKKKRPDAMSGVRLV